MANKELKLYRNYTTPKEPGSYFRMLCLTGKNKGLSYIFTKERLILGRSENVDIPVYDNKSSREHAELKRIGNEYILTDLGSQNGVIVNDLKVSQHQLSDGDTIIVGQTVYKFNKIKIEEERKLTIVEDDDDDEDHDDISDKKKKKEKKSNRPLVYGVIIIMMTVLFLPEEEKDAEKKSDISRIPKNIERSTTLAEMIEKKKKIADEELRKKIDIYLHRGLREHREKNFFRAIEQFELALIMDPNNGRASFYKNRAQQSLNEYIDTMFLKGKQDADAIKYRKALVSYCAVVSILQEHMKDERYKEAEENIEYLEEKLGYSKGDFKCF